MNSVLSQESNADCRQNWRTAARVLCTTERFTYSICLNINHKFASQSNISITYMPNKIYLRYLTSEKVEPNTRQARALNRSQSSVLAREERIEREKNTSRISPKHST